ncbi:MAG TPA: ferritin family protein [Candidatus Omnitrophota bacterium]|nr:ferritin family protein [Candidatus Omnitrophota bacterium]
MKSSVKKSAILLGIVLAFFLAAVGSIQAAEQATGPAVQSTLDNLMAAYNGENNAHARYLEFAKKADEEGYGSVASLFRAAARAEQVHFEHHAKAIENLGGTPKATIETPVVKTTRENLEAAIKGETYESREMYPAFLAQAGKEKNEEAVESFEHALAAETVHAKLYKEALDNLETEKGAKKDFYVCPVCGNVVSPIPGPQCPICGEPTEKFMPVS